MSDMLALAEALTAHAAALNNLAAATREAMGNGNAAPNAGEASGSSGSATNATGGTAGRKARSPAPSSPAPEEPAAEDAIDYATQVGPRIVALSKAKGRDVAVNLLGEFKTAAGVKVTKGPELEPEDYEAFLARLDEIEDDVA